MAGQARVRARHIEPELRALYDDLTREVAAMDLAPDVGVPAAAFEAAVGATGTRMRVNPLSDAFAAENRLADQLAELVDAQARVLSWLLALGAWVLVGLLGLLVLTVWNVPSESIVATVYATALASVWLRLGRRLYAAVRGELDLDRRLTEIEGRAGGCPISDER